MAELNDNALIELEELKLYLDYNDTDKDPFFELLINNVSDFLDRICGRVLKSATYTHERYDGGESKIFLKSWPVSNVAQVCSGKLDVVRIKYTSSTAFNAYVKVTTTGIVLTVDGTSLAEKTFVTYSILSTMATAINSEAGWQATVASSSYNSYPSAQIFRKLNRFALNQYMYLQLPDEPLDGYEIDYDNGILYFPSAFSSGWRNIFVTYTGGYSTVPGALQQICLELVKLKDNQRKEDKGMKSETIGRVYSYTRQDLKDALPPDMMAELNLFKSRDF